MEGGRVGAVGRPSPEQPDWLIRKGDVLHGLPKQQILPNLVYPKDSLDIVGLSVASESGGLGGAGSHF